MMENFTCIILAGGESKRMGEDKGLKLFQNQALVTYSIQLAKKLCDTIFISTNNPDYKQFEYPILNDIIPGKGPMGGIYSGLIASKTDWNLFLPCDTPFLRIEMLNGMQNHLHSNKVVIPKIESGRIHPLVGFYHKDLLSLILDHLQKNRLKMMGLLDETTTFYYMQSPENSRYFLNLNTPDDHQKNEY